MGMRATVLSAFDSRTGAGEGRRLGTFNEVRTRCRRGNPCQVSVGRLLLGAVGCRT